MKNILITGCCGHIGSFLIRKLHTRYNIVGVDNMATQRYCSLFNIDRSNFKFILKDYIDLTNEELKDIDCVIHLAAICDASSSFKNEQMIWEENCWKTHEFFEELSKYDNIKLIVFPSTTSVYGSAEDIMYENSDTDPQSPYAETKVVVEDLLKTNFAKKLNYAIMRFGTIFGISKGMRFHTAINKFCLQASLNISLSVYSTNYKQYRPYLGLQDMHQSIEIILANENMWNNTYNVLTDNFKLSDIVNILKQENQNLKIDFIDTPLLNQYSYEVNFDKIKQYGFYPKDNLEKEIKNTIGLLKNV